MCIKYLLDFFKKKDPLPPPPEPKKWTSVEMNADFINIMTLSGYRSALSDPDGENIFLPVDAEDQVVGEAVFKALEKSRMITPNTRESEEFFANGRITNFYPKWVDDCKKTYGYKTKKALYKGMKSCSLEIKDDMLRIKPWNQEKPGAFGPTKNKEADNVFISVGSSAEEVGQAVRLALSRATSDV